MTNLNGFMSEVRGELAAAIASLFAEFRFLKAAAQCDFVRRTFTAFGGRRRDRRGRRGRDQG
jgi:hypothetical protein